MRARSVAVVAALALLATPAAAAVKFPKPIPVADGWQPNEVLQRPPKIIANDTKSWRAGVTPDGLKYEFNQGGRGGVGDNPRTGPYWSIDCRRDAMTDKRACKVTSFTAKILILFSEVGTPRSICIIGHDFPGRTGAIRIDASPPIKTAAGGCIAGTHLPSMAKGTTITARFVEWPYDFNKDHSAPLTGLASALSLMPFIVNNVDRLAF